LGHEGNPGNPKTHQKHINGWQILGAVPTRLSLLLHSTAFVGEGRQFLFKQKPHWLATSPNQTCLLSFVRVQLYIVLLHVITIYILIIDII
jgi:hypothetical protein